MQMLYVCVHPVAVLKCCILHDLQFVNASRGCKRRLYGRGILQSRSHDCCIGASFCLPHHVRVSAFMICRGLCACAEMLWICVLYVRFVSKVRPITFGCVAMRSAVLFISRSRLLLYSEGSGGNRVQVVLSGFSVILLCFVQEKNFMLVWLYVFLCCTRACVCRCDGDVICVGHDLNWCSWWW